MEFETKLESIDQKISDYNKKVDELTNVISALSHSLGQESSSLDKQDIIDKIEKKVKDLEVFPNAQEAKAAFQKISHEIKTKQGKLNTKINELQTSLAKLDKTLEGAADKEGKKEYSELEKNILNLKKVIRNYRLATNKIEADDNEGKFEKTEDLISAQINTNKMFSAKMSKYIASLQEEINKITPPEKEEKENEDEISENLSSDISLALLRRDFGEFNLTINAVLTAIKMVDVKYQNLQELGNTLLNTDIKADLKSNFDNLQSSINEMANKLSEPNPNLSEEIKGELIALTNLTNEKIDNLIEKIELQPDFSDLYSEVFKGIKTEISNINVDVSKIFDLVKDFKTTVDLNDDNLNSSMEKIENMLEEYQRDFNKLVEENPSSEEISDKVKTQIKELNSEFYLDFVELFNNLSFEDESEDLKDFIENVKNTITLKTDENTEKLNEIMYQFKGLAKKIEKIEKSQSNLSDFLNPDDEDNIVYSFDDIQTDLAKMRLTLSNISETVSDDNDLVSFMDKNHDVNENAIAIKEKVLSLQENFEKLNSDVYDISLRTNKLILSSEDSVNELKNNLLMFRDLCEKVDPQKVYELFYELTQYFNDTNERLSVLNRNLTISESEVKSIKTALIYVGEWLDNATNVLGSIENNVSVLVQERNEQFANLVGRLKFMEDNTNKQFEKIDKKVASIEKSLKSLVGIVEKNAK